MAVNRLHTRPLFGRRTLRLAAAFGVLATVVLATSVAGGVEAPGGPPSYEAVASAEGVRVSFGAPGFLAVETFIDGGGPVSQSVIDGLGNSQAFASLPYPGDLAISGPGLLSGVTGLPSPPAYPFYVNSSYPTTQEAKFAQPGYELVARSAEQSSEGTTSAGGSSGESGIGVTKTRAVTSRDATTGTVTAEATGAADLINVGGVLRIVNAKAMARVTRAPGAEPMRESTFSIGAVTISGQSVVVSEKGFTIGPSNTPIPPDNPLIQALEQARIHVVYLGAQNNPDGVVSPGLVVTQEAQFPGGPLMVVRYVFGRMSARATVSGSPIAIGGELPVAAGGNGFTEQPGPSSSAPVESVGPAPSEPVAGDPSTPAGQGIGELAPVGTSGPAAGSGYEGEAGAPADPGTWSDAGSPTAPVAQGASSPIADQQPASGPSAKSVYLILVLGALVSLGGGLLIRVLGVKLV